MNFPVLINLTLALGVCVLLYRLQANHVSFTKRVFTGLGLGVVLGAAMQAFYGAGSPEVAGTNAWLDVVGSGYVKLLQMIVIPLIMVSIVQAILKLRNAASLGTISTLTIGILIATTIVAAAIGILMAKLFGLSAVGLTASTAEVARGEYLQGNLAAAKEISLPSMLLSFIPANPFLDMTGARKTSTIAVVVFSIFIGISATGIAGKKPEVFQSFSDFVHVAHVIVMRMVTLVLRLTPFGVFALMAKMVAGSSLQDILSLASFVAASYCALALMFLVHLLLVAGSGLNPLRFVAKIFPVLAFAFTSRTSAGSIPMSVATQTARLGTPEGIAQLRRLLRRHHRAERLRRHLPGHAGGDDRADRRHRPVHRLLPAAAARDRCLRLDRRGRGRRRRHLRRPDRAVGHGLAGGAGGPADFGGTIDRHGSHGAQRQRLDHGRNGDQPPPRTDRFARVS